MLFIAFALLIRNPLDVIIEAMMVTNTKTATKIIAIEYPFEALFLFVFLVETFEAAKAALSVLTLFDFPIGITAFSLFLIFV